MPGRGWVDPIQGTRMLHGGRLRTEWRSRVHLDHSVCEGCVVLSGHRAGDGWADGPGSPADTQLPGMPHVGRIYSEHAARTDTHGVRSNCLFSLMERLKCTPPGPRNSLGPCNICRHQSRLPRRARHGASAEVCHVLNLVPWAQAPHRSPLASQACRRP